MHEPIKMPPEVQAACDNAVAATLAGQDPLPEDLVALQGWLEIDGWELIADLPDEILLTDLRVLRQYFEDDWVMSVFLDWVPDEELDVDNLTDDDRLKWARYICDAVDRGKLSENECLLTAAHPVRLVATNGNSAYIVCMLLFQGQAGFDVEWHGIWKDRQEFLDYLSTLDAYCLYEHAADLTDEQILSMWNRPLAQNVNELTILASRENSSMASAWKEFLCLTQGDARAYKLFTGQYEALASKYDYFDEEIEDYDLPDEIDGKEVIGIDDEYIVGGELQWFDDSQTVEFDDVEDPAIMQWLSVSGWSRHISFESIQQVIQQMS